MAIRIRCFQCQEEIKLDYPQAGENVFCPYCGQRLISNFPQSAANSHRCPECNENISISRVSVPCPDCGTLYHESCNQKRLSQGRECKVCAQANAQTPFSNPIISAPAPPQSPQISYGTALDQSSSAPQTQTQGVFSRIFQNISNYFNKQRQEHNSSFDQFSQSNGNESSSPSPSVPPVPPSSRWSSSDNLQSANASNVSSAQQNNSPAPTHPNLSNGISQVRSFFTRLFYYLPTCISGLILLYLGKNLFASNLFQNASIFGCALMSLGIIFLLFRTPLTKRLLALTGIFSLLIGTSALGSSAYLHFSSPQIEPSFFKSLVVTGMLLLTLFIISRWNAAPNDRAVNSKLSILVPIGLCVILGMTAIGAWGQFRSTKLHDVINSLARRGVSDAQYLLGNYYLDEKLPDFNEEEALNWLDKASEQKHILACAKAAPMHFQGVGCDIPDADTAFRYWETAANGGNVESMVRLGDCYANGDGCQRSPVDAAKWYLEAAGKSSAEGQYKLACLYFKGEGVAANNSEGRYWLEKAAEGDYLEAMYEFGVRNVLGTGMPVNYNLGLDWLERAALKEHPESKEFIYQFYINGEGLEKVPDRAITWLTNESERSDQARNALNRFFIDNNGLKTRPNQGAQWLLKEAKRNNATAQCLLGECYRDGIGVSQSDTLAVKWFKEAADREYPKGQYNLGMAYLNGSGVEVDPQSAFELFLASANNGCVDAMYELGNCYFQGIGTAEDKPVGAQWFYKANTEGDKRPIKILDEYFIEHNGILEAPQLAIQWLQKRAGQGVKEAKEKLDDYYVSEDGLANNADDAIAVLLKRAKSGDLKSQTQLGKCYLLGSGVSRDYNAGVEWLYKAALQDYQPAIKLLDQYTLAGGKQTPEFNIKWLTRRAKEDSQPAQLYLGNYYLDETNNPENFNPAQGTYWLEKAGESGSSKALKQLENFYLSPSGIQNAPTKCVEWLKNQTDNATAQYLLSQYYRKGVGGLAPDVTIANTHLKNAASLGNSDAQFELGHSLIAGSAGGSASPQTGYPWIQAAAKNGNVQAQYEAGICNLNGVGTSKNEKNAVAYFEMGAKQGNAKSQYMLGKCLAQGSGTEKNDYRAVEMFKSAAIQGVPEASYEYALCCRDGRGCDVNKSAAWQYFCKAASGGVAAAECEKGKCLLKGEGTARNLDEGFRILEMAATGGNKDAQQVLDEFCLNDSTAMTLIPQQATTWLIQRSNDGLADAGALLDKLYVSHGDIESMPKAGITWVEHAAKNGNAQAQLKLANHYKNDSMQSKDVFTLYQKASQKGEGNPEAIYNLGMCYDQGRGTKISKVNAQKCFEIAAKKGYPLANQALGRYYYFGEDGIERDYSKAVTNLTIAANAGFLQSQYLLGTCYQYGKGAPKNLTLAVKWLTDSAQNGDVDAQSQLADCYLNLGQPENAIHWLKEAAKQGNALAQRNLGLCYLNGKGVYQDLSKAVDNLKLAANQNDVCALAEMGELLFTGKGVKKDEFEAVRMLRNALTPTTEFPQGHPKAYYLLGKAYMEGSGVNKNFKTAEEYLQKAVDLGSKEANMELQDYYVKNGMEENPEKAIRYIQTRAEAGDPVAQFNYGKCFLDGSGVKKDLQIAFSWFEKSAKQNNADGLYMLGLCYYQGWGTSADPTKALPLFKKAVKLTEHPQAKQKLKEMGIE